jgi:hypothetical protein
MARRRTNPHAERKRRLPFVTVIEREEPFLRVDSDEIEAECRRITNGGEFYLTMARAARGYHHVVHFASEHQAEAFRLWCHRTEIARRPAPQFSSPPHEKAAFRQAALLWGFRTGAIRRVLRAYRDTPGSLTLRDSAARQVLHAYRMPSNGYDDILNVFIEWVCENHWHWFNHQRHPGWLPFDDYYHWVIPQDAYPHSDD